MAFRIIVTFAACISQVLGACSSIEVRREWRAFTSAQKAEWISAVKVCYKSKIPRYQLTFSSSVWPSFHTMIRWSLPWVTSHRPSPISHPTVPTMTTLHTCTRILIQLFTSQVLPLHQQALFGSLFIVSGLFFPFHRYFVWAYNNALKTRCGYTGVAPYWNWTIGNLTISPLFLISCLHHQTLPMSKELLYGQMIPIQASAKPWV